MIAIPSLEKDYSETESRNVNGYEDLTYKVVTNHEFCYGVILKEDFRSDSPWGSNIDKDKVYRVPRNDMKGDHFLVGDRRDGIIEKIGFHLVSEIKGMERITFVIQQNQYQQCLIVK